MRRLILAFAMLLALAHPVAAGFHDLLDAARANDTAAARALLAAGTEPNGGPSGFPDGYTPLQWAARHGNTELILLLLEAGADTERRDFNGDRPLQWAASAGQAAAIRALVAAGSPVNSALDTYGSPLMLAARAGSAAALRALIDGGAWLDFPEQGGAALREAALAQSPDAVQLLLDAGADPNVADPLLSETPLHIAAAREETAIVEALLAAGADPAPLDGDGRAALHIAAFRGLPGNVAALLAAGADPLQRDANGNTPLIAAIEGKPFEWRDNDAAAALLAPLTPGASAAFARFVWAAMPRTAHLLLAAGADPDAQHEGWSALAGAARLDDPTLFDALIAAGADTARFGPEALHIAAAAGRIPAATRLLALGVSPDAPHAGVPPAQAAAEAGQLDMLRFLLDRGATPVPPEQIRLAALPLDLFEHGGHRSAALDWTLIETRAAWEDLRARQLEARTLLAAFPPHRGGGTTRSVVGGAAAVSAGTEPSK